MYRQNNSLLYAGISGTLFRGVLIIFLEIMLSIISLPFYFFIAPSENDKDFKGTVKVYRLRRRITLAALIIFLAYQLVNFFLAFTGIVIFPLSSDAKFTTW